MKEYIVVSRANVRVVRRQFDRESDAVELAAKMQKTKKYPVVVLKKEKETEHEIYFRECFCAKGEKQNLRYQYFK